MMNPTEMTRRLISKPRALFAAAACALAFGVMGAAPAQAAQHGETRCVAQAVTIFGDRVSGTKSRETRKSARRACRAAIRECDARIDRRRNPLAECRVIRRVSVNKPVAAKPLTRCVAEAFTRRGRALDNTKAVEVSKRQRVACGNALDRCERKLDRKRDRTGRNLPHARCEVTRTAKIYQRVSWR